MNIRHWISFHAAFLALVGLMFLLYSPLIMAWLGFDRLAQDSQGYWAMVSFARLFGMALVAWAITILATRQLANRSDQEEQFQRKLLGIIVVGDLLGAFSAAIQAASVWALPSGWLISGGFGLLALISLLFGVLSARTTH